MLDERPASRCSQQLNLSTTQQLLQKVVDHAVDRRWVGFLDRRLYAPGVSPICGMGVVVSVEQKDGRVAMSDDGIVCGEYRLLERVASGGMGTVWRARHPDYERDVAVKVMGAEVAENDQYRDWFRREIWAHARLSHRHVVRLFDHEAPHARLFSQVVQA